MKITLTLDPQQMYDMIIQPAFADIAAGATMYPDTMHLWTMVDDVSLANGQTIIDIYQKQNFLKRKDRSCHTVFSQVATTDTRKITITELYSAVQMCQEEFFKGALLAARKDAAKFRNMAMDILKRGTRADIITNAYFGDVTRPDHATGLWNWNAIDGVVVKISKYITDGLIPAGQVMGALPDGALTGQDAYDIFQDAYNRRSDIMDTLDDGLLVFTVDKGLAEAYMDYLIASGSPTASSPTFIQNGIPVLAFKGIPIYVEKTWKPILAALNSGTAAHMCILTLRNNFMYGTDKTYGGGANLNQAYRLWYSEDDDVWRNKIHLTGGTEIVTPKEIVFGITNIS